MHPDGCSGLPKYKNSPSELLCDSLFRENLVFFFIFWRIWLVSIRYMISNDSLAGETAPLLGGRKTRLYMYGTHSLQAFGDRLWAFAVPMLFINIWPQTLLPSAIFTFTTNLANFLLMAPLGSWLDRTNRMRVMSVAVVGQCIFQITNCCVLWVMVSMFPLDGTLVWTAPLTLCFVVLLVTAIVSQLMGCAATLSIEKDWLVEIVKRDAHF